MGTRSFLLILVYLILSSSAFSEWSSGGRKDLITAASTGWFPVYNSVTPTKMVDRAPVLASTKKGTIVVWWELDRLKYKWWERNSGTWNPQIEFLPKLPGDLQPTPAAIIHRGDNILDVVTYAGKSYYHIYWMNDVWSNWEPIGRPPTTQDPGPAGPYLSQTPAITASKSGPMTITVWATVKGSVWRCKWQHPQWQAWEEIGRPSGVDLLYPPGVVVRPNSTIDLVVPGSPNGQLYHSYFLSSGKFGGWEKIEGNSYCPVGLSSPSSDRLDVWARGAKDLRMYHNVWTDAKKWSGFETSINNARAGENSFVTGPSLNIADNGHTSIAAFEKNGTLMVRTWVDPPKLPIFFPGPKTVTVRRPMTSEPRFLTPSGSEASIIAIPSNQASCGNSGAVYLSTHDGELHRQAFDCVFNGTGKLSQNGYESCTSNAVRTSANSVTGTDWGSNDNQVTVTSNGSLVWIHQRGCYDKSTSRTSGNKIFRGVEEVHYSGTCGSSWNTLLLDPCDPNGPFDASFCHSNPGSACDDKLKPTGTDRPEILSSQYENRVYMAVGVAGTNIYNLVLLRSKQGSTPSSWESFDTGLGSGGASSLSETKSHLYVARCEYGDPANVGLYAYNKSNSFKKSEFHFVGNLADADCSMGDAKIWVNQTNIGPPLVSYVYPIKETSRWSMRRGASILTPGGVARLKNDSYSGGKTTALPTLIRSTGNHSLLYWYELDSSNNWSVKAAIGDAYSQWTNPMAISKTNWASSSPGPWNWKKDDVRSGPWDYIHGTSAVVGSKTKFLIQWLQYVGPFNEVFYGVVE